jgi:hypothetical protein
MNEMKQHYLQKIMWMNSNKMLVSLDLSSNMLGLEAVDIDNILNANNEDADIGMSDDCLYDLAQNVSTPVQPPTIPAAIPISRNYNYVGKSLNGQARISDVRVYASLQRGQYQLKGIKLNKYQPVELFQLLDADTGLRANRSSTGKKKDDDRNLIINPINSAEVSLLYSLLQYSLTI